MPAFITNTQFLVRYDWRWVGKQVLDNNSAATEGELQGSGGGGAVLAAFIREASEMVMGAAAVGDRYSEADITTYGGQLLVRIVSDLTMGLILKRRARGAKDDEALTRSYEEALSYLELLRRGERIFYAVPNVPEAGLPATQNLAPSPYGTGNPLITDNSRIFGSIGWDRNFGYGRGGC